MMTNLINNWKRNTKQLKMEAHAIYLAYKDPRVPWYARLLILCIVGYAFCPVDRFLGTVPILGYVDHLVFVPLVVILAFRKKIPSPVLTDCRERAMNQKRPANCVDASIIIFILFLFVSLVFVSTTWVMKDWNLIFGQWFGWFSRMVLISESNIR